VAPKALQKMKRRVRQLTNRSLGWSLSQVMMKLAQYLRGWRGYFRIADTGKAFRLLDGWIRRRLRAYVIKQWKRGVTAYRQLRELGLSRRDAAGVASHTRQWWRISNSAIHKALPNSFFDKRGLPRLGP
jgi:RNA-directed DNA polymerase